MVETNKRGYEQDRIARVIPLATQDKLSVTTRTISGGYDGVGLTMHGPPYPPSHENPPSEVVTDQTFEVDIICPSDGGDSEDPKFDSYDGKVMKVSWKHKIVCSKQDNPTPPNDSGGIKKTGSGIGYFFLV